MTEDRQRQIFSNNLRRLIDVSGKTQKDVADAIGVSQQIMNVWARGKAIPRMGKIQRLADYFGIEKSQLIDEQPEGPSIPQFSNIFPISKKAYPAPRGNRLRGAHLLQRRPRELHRSGHGHKSGFLSESPRRQYDWSEDP